MERRTFLERVRTRLGRAPGSPVQPPPRFKPVAPSFVDDPEKLKQVFVERQIELGVTVTVVDTRWQAQAAVEHLLDERKSHITCPPDMRWPGIASRWVEHATEAAFGLCEADWAIAETGSVVIRTGGPHKREVSLLPPAVGFFVARSHLLARIGDLLLALSTDPNPLLKLGHRSELPPNLILPHKKATER